MSTVTHKVKAVVRNTNGTKKYVQVGRATTDEQGRIAIIIESLPYDLTSWTGWLNLFPLDEAADDIPF